MDKKELLLLVEKHGKSFTGKSQLISYLNGEHIARKAAIQAYCYDCMGWCADGRVVCITDCCPLYPFSQFNKYNIVKSDKE